MIPRVSSREFLDANLMLKAPVIIVDALDDWHIAARWTPEHLTKTAGHRRVTVSVSENGKFSYKDSKDINNSMEYALQEMSLADAAQMITADGIGPSTYIMQQSIPAVFPELQDGLIFPPRIQSLDRTVNLWFGRNTYTPLHFDMSNNFFAQTYGRKSFVIFSPQDTAHVYPYPHDTAVSNCSYIDAESPDIRRYPHFSLATPLQFELEAGEALFLPAFWWHQVRSREVSISVSTWWPPQFSQFIDANNAARTLVPLYQLDRLTHFQNKYLLPDQLRLLTAAQLWSSKGSMWAACVLSLAAFDELCRQLQPNNQPSGCALTELSKDLEKSYAAIFANNDLLAQHRPAFNKVLTFAELASRYDETLIASGEVESLLADVSSMEATVRRMLKG